MKETLITKFVELGTALNIKHYNISNSDGSGENFSMFDGDTIAYLMKIWKSEKIKTHLSKYRKTKDSTYVIHRDVNKIKGVNFMLSKFKFCTVIEYKEKKVDSFNLKEGQVTSTWSNYDAVVPDNVIGEAKKNVTKAIEKLNNQKPRVRVHNYAKSKKLIKNDIKSTRANDLYTKTHGEESYTRTFDKSIKVYTSFYVLQYKDHFEVITAEERTKMFSDIETDRAANSLAELKSLNLETVRKEIENVDSDDLKLWLKDTLKEYEERIKRRIDDDNFGENFYRSPGNGKRFKY